MSKASGWLIIMGSVVMMLGLCFLPAAFGPHADQSMLAGGVAIFAFGTLTCSGGIYLKARVLQSTANSTATAKSQPKRVRGGCDMCGVELPVIHCRVHQIHICGNCVADHYDFRSCAYVPSTRRSVPSRSAARFAAKA